MLCCHGATCRHRWQTWAPSVNRFGKPRPNRPSTLGRKAVAFRNNGRRPWRLGLAPEGSDAKLTPHWTKATMRCQWATTANTWVEARIHLQVTKYVGLKYPNRSGWVGFDLNKRCFSDWCNDDALVSNWTSSSIGAWEPTIHEMMRARTMVYLSRVRQVMRSMASKQWSTFTTTGAKDAHSHAPSPPYIDRTHH